MISVSERDIQDSTGKMATSLAKELVYDRKSKQTDIMAGSC
jgi:hypothetical protein